MFSLLMLFLFFRWNKKNTYQCKTTATTASSHSENKNWVFPLITSINYKMVIGSDPLRIIKRLILIKSNLLPNNQWNKTPKCGLNSLIVWIQSNLPSKLLIVSVTLHETFTRCKALCLILNKLYYCLLVHNIHLKKKKMWIKSMFNVCFSELKKRIAYFPFKLT